MNIEILYGTELFVVLLIISRFDEVKNLLKMERLFEKLTYLCVLKADLFMSAIKFLFFRASIL